MQERKALQFLVLGIEQQGLVMLRVRFGPRFPMHNFRLERADPRYDIFVRSRLGLRGLRGLRQLR